VPAFAACLVLWLGCALAGELPKAPELRPLDGSSLYLNRWSAVEMLNAPVRGADGEPVGHVIDLLVGDEGQVRTVLVELGPLFSVGDTAVGVPWPDVRLGPQLAYLQVPADEVRSGAYSIFTRVADAPKAAAPQDEWRLRALLGDLVALFDAARYGLVKDVLFDDHGRARAVVVSRGAGTWGAAGDYAYPWQGFHADAAGAFVLPFRSSETLAFQHFDYGRLHAVSRLAGGERSAAAGGTAPSALVPLFGSSKASRDKREIFRWLDRDGDGAISRAEAAWRPALADAFAAADRNRDGRVDVEEFSQFEITGL
jgi:sporulation protein YlmC with PRC-barrel domain